MYRATTILMAAALCFCHLANVNAQEPVSKRPSFSLEPEFGSIVRAKRLLGTSVRNSSGDEVGTIRDLALDLESGHVALAVIELADESAVAIPWYAITLESRDDIFSATVLANAMTGARKLDLLSIERDLTRGWALERFKALSLEPYYRHTSKVVTQGNAAKSDQKKFENLAYPLTTVTKLWRVPVQGQKDEPLGWIEDFAIAPKSGVIAYAALAMDNKQPIPETLYPIPLTAFVVKAKSAAWMIELPRHIVEGTPTFAAKSWPTKLTRGWVEYVIERYNRNPLGGVEHELRANQQINNEGSPS